MESINRFLEEHVDLEISLSEFIELHSNRDNFHNHTIENLYLYFDLQKHIDKGRVKFYPRSIFIIDNRRYKWFVYDFEDFLDYFNFSLFSEVIKKKTVVYTSQLFKSKIKGEKIKECIYNLQDLFNLEKWVEKEMNKTRKEVKKKFTYRMVYSLNYVERDLVIRDLVEDDLPEMENLHKRWCEYKLNDPKTFKMMFSSNRYNRCIESSFKDKYLSKCNWFRKGFFYQDKLVAVRLCYILNQTSYDISFFSCFWELPSNIVNNINTWCMKKLLEEGIIRHNCGSYAGVKGLEIFKKHLLSYDIISYRYKIV